MVEQPQASRVHSGKVSFGQIDAHLFAEVDELFE
jgi:hypothetical protein